MRKLFKALVSVMLCLALILSATSCAIVDNIKSFFSDNDDEDEKPDRVRVDVPEGYTGGSVYANPEYNEVYWLETLEEAKDAISRLEAHGSTVYKSAFFDYTPEGYDVKVMLQIDRTYIEPLNDGQSPFDRKAGEVDVSWYLFDEYIPTDELVYMNAEDVCRLHSDGISVEGEKCNIKDSELLSVDYGLPEFGLDWPENATPPNEYVIYYQGEFIIGVTINSDKGPLPKDMAEETLKSAVIVGNTDNKRVKYPEEDHMNIECYWFETYDELISAIETLKAHGSTINSYYVFDCEGMMLNNTPLDCKYVISFSKHNNPKLDEGQNFFERKIDDVYVNWFVYDEFYPIFSKSSVSQGFEYEAIFRKGGNRLIQNIDIEDYSLLTIDYGIPEYGLDWPDNFPPNGYEIYYDGLNIYGVEFDAHNIHWNEERPTPEFALEFVKTIILVK